MSPGTVTNSGVLSATVAGGIGVTFTYGGTVTNTGSINGVAAGVAFAGVTGVTGTVTNYGSIGATGTAGTGAVLRTGGSVINGSTASTGWSITGALYGVSMLAGSGGVANYGTIRSTGTTGAGIDIGGNGAITNGAGTPATWLIEGAAGVDIGANGTVFNDGTILGLVGAGVFIGNAGSLANGSAPQTGRTILGVSAGVDFNGGINAGAGTVTNYGSIGATGTAGTGAVLRTGGSVINGSTASTGWSITGALYGVSMLAGSGGVANYGTIRSTGTTGAGIDIGGNGAITNGAGTPATWLIEGATGVDIGANGTVFNDGTILGLVGAGVFIGNDGSLANGSAPQTGRTILGVSAGVDFNGGINAGAGTVTNYGSIGATGTAGTGAVLRTGGSVINGSTASTGWSITGALYGVSMLAGSGEVVNYGTIDSTGTTGAGIDIGGNGAITNGAGTPTTWLIEGATGIDIGANGTVFNDGTILGLVGAGVFIGNAGSLANGSAPQTGRTILGVSAGVDFNGGINAGAGTVTNYGSIGATGTAGTGAVLRTGGSVINGSTASTGWSITGALYGVSMLAGSGGVANYGTIRSTGTTGAGIDIGGNGAITNGAGTPATWLIEGATGIDIGANGTVFNDGTILGLVGAGVFIGNDGSLANGSAPQTGRTILGVSAGVDFNGGINAGAGTVTNYGSIGASGTAGTGAVLRTGGSVINGSTASTGWSITGALYGVSMLAGSGGVANYGTIRSTGTTGAGIDIGGNGAITNGAGTPATWLIEGATGVVIGANGNVFNDGTILGLVGAGVFIGNDGSLANGSAPQTGRTILGVSAGVDFNGGINAGAGTVTNYGSIGATGTAGTGAVLRTGGSVINGSTASTGWSITGALYGVSMLAGSGGVANYGTIRSTGTTGAGIDIGGNGAITNGAGTPATWLIEGATGIDIGANGTVFNDGTILGLVGAGVFIGNDGSLANGSAPQTGRTILGVSAGVDFNGGINAGAGTVTNYGSIGASGTAGTGAVLRTGGSVINGSTASTGWSITGALYGVSMLAGSGGVANYGTIRSTGTTGAGIDIGGNGAITNGAGTPATWLIEGATGVVIGANGNVFNDGTILGLVGAGVFIGNDGSLANGSAPQTGRTILGVSAGVDFNGGINAGAGTVTNYGSIGATGTAGTGAVLRTGGSVINGSTASTGWSITGALYGVSMLAGSGEVVNYGTIDSTGTKGAGIDIGGGGSTILNAGTIGGNSGIAVLIGNGGDRLIVKPGAVFGGKVITDGSGNVLELASAATSGTLAGIGTNFTGLQSIAEDAGATWLVSGAFSGVGAIGIGANAAMEIGGTGTSSIAAAITNNGTLIAASGELALTGTLGGSGELAIAANAALAVAGTVAQPVVFSGTNATLILDQPTHYTGTLSGMLTSDTIELVGVVASKPVISGGSLTIQSSAGPLVYGVRGDYTGETLTAVAVTGGTDIVFGNTGTSNGRPVGPVEHYATADLLDSNGKLTSIGADGIYTLDLGSAAAGDDAPSDDLLVGNSAPPGPTSDALSGGWLADDDAEGFINTGFDPFFGVPPGALADGGVIELDTDTPGTFTETIDLLPYSTNLTEFPVALPIETIVVVGTVTAASKPGDGGGEGNPKASIFRDPHITTFDGLYYNFQTAGEFVLVKDAKGGTFQVQARLSAPTGVSNYSVVTEIGIQVGADVVTIDATRAQAVWVDGAPISFIGNTYSLAGGLITRTAGGYVVALNTGQAVTADILSTGLQKGPATTSSGINLSISLGSSAAHGSVVGLLGDYSGKASADLTLADGTPEPANMAAATLYGVYANSWRVAQATSLLDYGAGQTTATFTDTLYPGTPISIASFPTAAVAAASALVAQSGITDPGLQQDAIYDYLLTGDPTAVNVESNLQQQGITTTTAGATPTTTAPPPEAGIIAAATTIVESSSGTATAAFELYRSGDISAATTLSYAVVAPGAGYVGAAAFGGVLPSGSVSFTAGQTIANVPIALTAGIGAVPSAILAVQISAPGSVDVIGPTAEVAIINPTPVAGPAPVFGVELANDPAIIPTVSGSTWSFDLGTLTAAQIAALGTLDVAVMNNAAAGADALSGTLVATGNGGLLTAAVTSFGAIQPGAIKDIAVLIPNRSSTVGGIETLTISPFDTNSGGYDAAVAAQTVTLSYSEATAPCFATGTRLATESGPRQVQDLRIGDRMLTAQGKSRPVTWIGHRRVLCSRHPMPEKVWPIRVARDAFAAGQPSRDLYLSPDHAVFVQGCLIPIKHLVNGRSIATVEVAEIQYWHVELATHDVLLAEDLPCESYLDAGNRCEFDNGADPLSLHPDFSVKGWDNACAPLVQSGGVVLAEKRRLFDRAGAHPLRSRPTLYVICHGRPLGCHNIGRGLLSYPLPDRAGAVQLVSPSFVPACQSRESLDIRRLGVRLLGVRIDGQVLDLDDDAFARGFYPTEISNEGACRWTNGQATLALQSSAKKITFRLADNVVPLRATPPAAGAIANAVWHATGTRVRSFPITLDKLIPA